MKNDDLNVENLSEKDLIETNGGIVAELILGALVGKGLYLLFRKRS
jgi:hypothetical protein